MSSAFRATLDTLESKVKEEGAAKLPVGITSETEQSFSEGEIASEHK